MIGDEICCPDEPDPRLDDSSGSFLVIKSLELIPGGRQRLSGVFASRNDLQNKYSRPGEVIIQAGAEVRAKIRSAGSRPQRPPHPWTRPG